MSKLDDLEVKMNDLFVTKAPKLPPGGKKVLVEWAPWISVIFGAFVLITALGLWHWAHYAGNMAQYARDICATYGGTDCGASISRLTIWVWFALIFIVVEGVLYLMAFPALRDRKKQGWDYLYYAALLNLAYAVVLLFTSYSTLGSFIGSLIGSAIGFYLIFQIRSFYLGNAEAPAASEPSTPAETSSPTIAPSVTEPTTVKPVTVEPTAVAPAPVKSSAPVATKPPAPKVAPKKKATPRAKKPAAKKPRSTSTRKTPKKK